MLLCIALQAGTCVKAPQEVTSDTRKKSRKVCFGSFEDVELPAVFVNTDVDTAPAFSGFTCGVSLTTSSYCT